MRKHAAAKAIPVATMMMMMMMTGITREAAVKGGPRRAAKRRAFRFDFPAFDATALQPWGLT